MEVRLVLLGGAVNGREIPLPATVFTIGRSPKCHLRINSPMISRQHCALANWGGKVVVRDLNSTNGTFVNDRPVKGEVRIKNGDIVAAGGFRFEVSVKDSKTTGLPVPVVRASEVHWLLEQTGDEAVLTPDDTQHFDSAATQAQMDQMSDESPDLSAGDYLRDFFGPKKKK